MPRTFAYTRVSTFEQDTQNQFREIEAAGFNVDPHRSIAETISGSIAIAQRPEFSRLLDKMENGDVLIDQTRPPWPRCHRCGKHCGQA